ncbi:putative UDP-glucuronate:xylan alpha-glucuronosyltransferase 3 isoform X2 [Zingiber officinale]|nr:putative UDP-glucuronate:xylan alpha-glucuronosyltransferase 3 isoform X2 [Zingiber officinale]
MWQATAADPRYISHLEIEWNHLSAVLQDLKPRDGNLRVGLLNFNVTEARIWQHEQPKTEVSLLHLDYADTSITWNVLYPEWIDEEEEDEAPACPSLPLPQAKEGSSVNLVAVKLPCDRSRRWNRDVARLHLQLSAAKLAAGKSPVRVLILTECRPIPNLFSCKDLVRREGNLWLYEPEAATLEGKLRLPIGSCQLAVPFEAKTRVYTEVGWRREAYATILHSADQYVCGAIAAAKSIRLSGSARDLVILVDETISRRDRAGLESAGWKVRTIERIRNPKAKRDAYNEWNYSKFRLWQLTEYDKVVFLDADLLVLRNIDFLFALPEVSAIGNNATLFNSGVMVVEPSECTFQWLMDNIEVITSYNGGDQGYLNEVFTWWHRVPRHTNYLKHFWEGDTEQRKARKERFFAADPPLAYVVHYLGLKPWLCFRDYDCNWDMRMFWGFASDGAHATWWRVHDALPEELQRFCMLQTRSKAFLEYNRRQAEKEEYPDGHWRRNITDPRLHICTEEFCNWRSMLTRWGDTDAYPRSSKPSL